MTKKELPPVEPAAVPPKLTVRQVQDEISRAAQAESDKRDRAGASSFLDKFFALFADYSFRTSYNHKRKKPAISGRGAKEIVSELRMFYERRPRPWRAAGYRPKPVHAIRFRYRRNQATS